MLGVTSLQQAFGIGDHFFLNGVSHKISIVSEGQKERAKRRADKMAYVTKATPSLTQLPIYYLAIPHINITYQQESLLL